MISPASQSHAKLALGRFPVSALMFVEHFHSGRTGFKTDVFHERY